MERNKSNTRRLIKALIKKTGSRTGAALAINCTESYIYAMESGKVIPGVHLFEKIVDRQPV